MKMFMHTPKAVKRGCPADRLFVVTTILNDGYFRAWKCTVIAGAIVWPGSKVPQKINEANLRKIAKPVRTRNGAEPTAEFKPDSLYKVVSTQDVERIAAGIPKLVRAPTTICFNCGQTMVRQ